jgi:glycosyltransferase involved in cell wall biosynthesis
MSYSIIIPIYNEEKSLSLLLKELKILDNDYQIIIVNDGSNDKTKNILDNVNEFDIINLNNNTGKGNAIRIGLDYVKKDNVILFDGDLEIGVKNIKSIVKEFNREEFDVIIGIRWYRIFEKINIHRIGNYILNTFFNLMYNSSFRDVLCCLKIMKTETFKTLDIQSEGFNVEVETLAKLKLKKATIKEVLVSYSRRTIKQGKKIRMLDSLKIIKTIIKHRYNFINQK